MIQNKHNKKHREVNYNFLISYDPLSTTVKRERGSVGVDLKSSLRNVKNADNLAQQTETATIKKSLIRSLAIVSFVLILEVGIYLARSRFGLN